jgi:hypothetical protein
MYARLSHQQRSSLRFLHCRKTLHSTYENYLYDDKINNHYFARWAFTTFPSLKVIIFGDFSYGNKYTDQEVFYRVQRSEGPIREQFRGLEIREDGEDRGAEYEHNSFKQLKNNDRNFDVEACLAQWKHVYQACPSEPLYRKDF